MEILRKIETGHYNDVFEVLYRGKLAVAKFQKPITFFTANIEAFLGNVLLGDNRTYNSTERRQDFEISRLIELDKKGAPVPKIIAREEKYFVMDNITGYTLAEQIEKGLNPDLNSVFKSLNRLHFDFGVYHGSPHPRNIIINDSGVYWVDWETRLKNKTLKANQQRDIKILCRDLSRKYGADKIKQSLEQSYTYNSLY